MTTDGGNFLFVIDTNEYAGNFEREMTAYLTGQIGDCEVGDDFAALFAKDFPQVSLFDNVISVPDEHGCARPATIWPNPRYGNDGMGGHYLVAEADQAKLCKAYVKAEEDYWLPLIKQKQAIIKDLEAGKTVSNWTIAAARREIAQHEKTIEKAKKLKKVSCFPAYMSVGIWFDTEPTEQQIALMKKRAAKFAEVKRGMADYEKNFSLTIEGFRLISFSRSSKEKKI